MKRILSIIAALLAIMSIMTFAVGAAVGEVESGYTPASGSVGISSLSEITDPAGAYHLTDDITVDATYAEAFSGVLDGCGHTVTVSAPMFAELNGTVKNMILNGSIKATDTSAAAVALKSTNGMTAMNITSNVDITVSGTASDLYAAAIVCHSESVDVLSFFVEVVNNGDISIDLPNESASGKPRAAGIAARINCADFTDCMNNGVIKVSGYQSVTGGICARANNDGGDVDFYHCVNNGDITGIGYNAYVGGIAAYIGHKSIAEAEFNFNACVNTGEITANYYAAGIVAYVYANGTQYPVVENCINTGNITFGPNTGHKKPNTVWGSPFVGYANSTKSIIKNNIDMGALICGVENFANYAFIGCSSADLSDNNYSGNYVTDCATKFDYLVYSETADNVIAIDQAGTALTDTTIDYIKSEEFTNTVSGFVKTDSLPVTQSGDGWDGGNYVMHVEKHVCSLSHVQAKEDTCGVAGNIEYYVCSCGKYYKDAEAKIQIIDKSSVVIPITKGHTWGDVAYDWTYGDDGVPTQCKATRTCGVCGLSETIIAQAFDIEKIVVADCQTEGVSISTALFGSDYAWAGSPKSPEYPVAKNPKQHTAGYVWCINNDGTHSRKYICCGALTNTAQHVYNETTKKCTTCGYTDGATLYNLTFVVDGKVLIATKTCVGATLRRPAAPAKEGYIYEGWFTKENGEGDGFSFTYNTEGDTTYYAYYTNKLTIMFRVVQLDGSSRMVTIRIDDFPYGEKLPVPESSEYARSVPEGYYVIGWYTSSQFTTEFDFDAPITRKNTNVYGKLAELKGWCKIDGEWYYYNEDGTKATGFSRVPYNTELGHAPNADDLAYFNANSETSKYTDATTAVYCFGEDGKLLRKTGIVDDKGSVRYAVDGVIAWHVGLVEADGEYYYFGGDANGGGNVMLTGNVYATRNTTKLDMVKSGVYTFAEDGKMCKYEGLTEIDGVLYYYEDYCRSKGTGVVKTAEGYIYVRTTNLEVVTDKQYWVSKTAESGVIKGIYVIDENGFIKDPVLVNSEATTGIFDGYYYVDGEVQYAAGAIEIDGDIYYVRANGQIVAGGEYWVTQSSELLPAGKYTFDNDGKLVK